MHCSILSATGILTPALPPGPRPLHYIWSQRTNQIATA
jgi:hypothetical protein